MSYQFILINTTLNIILLQVSCVINYDVPVYMKTYIHRVGRTARAGEYGVAYTILRPQEVTIVTRHHMPTVYTLR